MAFHSFSTLFLAFIAVLQSAHAKHQDIAPSSPDNQRLSLDTTTSFVDAHLRLVPKSVTDTVTVFTVPENGTDISDACLTALTASLECSSLLTSPEALYTWGGLSGEALDLLCIDSCTSAIASFRANVLEACSDDVYTDPIVNSTGYVTGTDTLDSIYNIESISVRPIALVDYYFLNYNLLCLKDDVSAEYCYLLTGNGTSYNLTESNPCGTCSLEPLRLQAEDARTNDESLAETYSSSASACGVTAVPLTTATAVFLDNPNTIVDNATTSCSGSTVALPTSLSCDEAALQYSVGTAQMLSDNHLQAGCADWPGSATELCIQNTCDTYTVQSNDTCRGVASAHNITLTQLLAWNPSIDPYCVNFAYTEGHVICMSNPMGYEKPTVTITDVSGTTPTTAAALPDQTAPGSNPDCGAWYLVKEGDYCAIVTTAQGISLADFQFLNPEVWDNCTNLWKDYSYCVEAVGDISTYAGYGGATSTTSAVDDGETTTYDVATLTTVSPPTYNFTTTSSLPLASGSLNNCYDTFENTYGDLVCVQFANWYGVALSDFLRWNPSLDTNSTSMFDCVLQNNTAYCAAFYDNDVYTTSTATAYVAAPTDSTSGATTECLEWYETVTGDTCQGILDSYQIPLSSFYSWNPAVGDQCQNMWLEASYCVAGPGWEYVTGNSLNNATEFTTTAADTTTAAPGSTATTSSVPTSTVVSTITSATTTSSVDFGTSTFSTPPGPTQTGIISTCDTYAEPISGDGCWSFANRYGASLDDFYTWNPAVGTDCSALWLEEAYCVGVSS